MSARDRRALKWGGAIAAASLVFAIAVKPYVRALGGTRDELRSQRDLLARERAVLTASGRFPAALRQSQSALTERSTPLFDGLDELSATSDLSDDISKAALAHRVLIQQLETRKAEALEEGLVALSVDIRAEGDFEGVLHFLDSLERGEKLIHVSALTLTRVDRPAANGVPDTEVISLTGTMTGYAAFPATIARVADTTPTAGIDRQ
ncbi:MAG TPA: GspMb/PilO family protein [Gemmatimonadaceae bacterium]|nr:GspMb/PilO family protein [Gemmatimonadaceae bacterium]